MRSDFISRRALRNIRFQIRFGQIEWRRHQIADEVLVLDNCDSLII
jgi:hypothetical protein